MRRLPRKLLANDHRMARTPHGNGPAVTMVMAVPMVVPAMLREFGRRRVERGRIRLGAAWALVRAPTAARPS